MKRFIGNGLRVGSVLLMAVILSGCVAQGDYDALKFAQRNCEAERERLSAELASSRNTNRTLGGEITRLKDLLQNREEVIVALKQQMSGTQDALAKMTSIYEQLASKQVPIITTPLPEKVNTAIKDFAAKYPNLVQFDEEKGILKFVSDLLFDLGSADVKAQAATALGDFADIMKMADASEFDAIVVGHTDNIPIKRAATLAKHATNWHLSVHRSISVMNILMDAGVAPVRMGVMGYGEYRPIAPNDTLSNRAKNRRVEIYLVPKQQTLGSDGGVVEEVVEEDVSTLEK